MSTTPQPGVRARGERGRAARRCRPGRTCPGCGLEPVPGHPHLDQPHPGPRQRGDAVRTREAPNAGVQRAGRHVRRHGTAGRAPGRRARAPSASVAEAPSPRADGATSATAPARSGGSVAGGGDRAVNASWSMHQSVVSPLVGPGHGDHRPGVRGEPGQQLRRGVSVARAGRLALGQHVLRAVRRPAGSDGHTPSRGSAEAPLARAVGDPHAGCRRQGVQVSRAPAGSRRRPSPRRGRRDRGRRREDETRTAIGRRARGKRSTSSTARRRRRGSRRSTRGSRTAPRRRRRPRSRRRTAPVMTATSDRGTAGRPGPRAATTPANRHTTSST